MTLDDLWGWALALFFLGFFVGYAVCVSRVRSLMDMAKEIILSGSQTNVTACAHCGAPPEKIAQMVEGPDGAFRHGTCHYIKFGLPDIGLPPKKPERKKDA